MEKFDNATLASVCRAQANLASCQDTRDVLLELARRYESSAASLTVEAEKAPPQEIERAFDERP